MKVCRCPAETGIKQSPMTTALKDLEGLEPLSGIVCSGEGESDGEVLGWRDGRR